MTGFEQSLLAREATIDYKAVFRLAALGDRVCRQLRDQSLGVWGAFAANLVLAYDPERVLIGGGISASDEVIGAIREYIHRHALTPWGKVAVERASLGDDAALLGCEWLVSNTTPAATLP
jgi:glucokinase